MRSIAVIIILFIIQINISKAQTHTTISSGTWQTADTWDIGIPDYTDNWNPAVMRSAAIQHDVTLGTGVEDITFDGYWNTISITNGATLTINVNTIAITDQLTYPTNINVIDGTLIINGTLEVRNGTELNIQANGAATINGDLIAAGTGGIINVYPGGNLDVNGSLSLEGGNSQLNSTGVFETDYIFVLGGSTSLSASTSFTVNNDLVVAGNSSFSIDAGIVSVNGDYTNTGTALTTIDGFLDVAGNVYNNSDITGTGGIGWGITWFPGGGSTVENAPPASVPPANPYSLATGGPYFSPLPVKLLSFSGMAINNSIQLSWTTLQEENFDYFTVERSSDGSNFHAINTIKGTGNSSVEIDYEFIDTDPEFGNNYYRLKATDFDGSTEYFKVIAVDFTMVSSGLNLYPNPSDGNYIELNFLRSHDMEIEFSLYSISGYLMEKRILGGTNLQIEFNEQLKQGTYIALIKAGNIFYNKKVLIK